MSPKNVGLMIWVPTALAALLVLWSVMAGVYCDRSALSAVEYLRCGGGVERSILMAEPWRVVTATMLHANTSHLVVNVLMTGVIGALTLPHGHIST